VSWGRNLGREEGRNGGFFELSRAEKKRVVKKHRGKNRQVTEEEKVLERSLVAYKMGVMEGNVKAIKFAERR